MKPLERRRIELLRKLIERPGLRRADLVFMLSAHECEQTLYERVSSSYRRDLKWLEEKRYVADESFPGWSPPPRLSRLHVTDEGNRFLDGLLQQGE